MAASDGRRRRVWVIVAVSVVVLALAAWAMTSLILADSAGGSAAIEQAERAAAPGLGDLERGAARRGQRLDVEWSAVPNPTGGAHMVTARVRLLPSGQGGTAGFVVTERGVAPQDALARRLVTGMTR
ncbi:hypothetical protein [Miltoncostaea marina]|uniref:hypothetical protein n=1 Tax=Miltoncostaea marina TaxID=2843215 RepID=UPI001C3D8612|nr:hypothetical protein [Miltoncostaea marina]